MPSSREPAAAGVVDLRCQGRRGFLVGITAAAGWLDTLAFLYLGKVFISFMSGNLLFVGIGACNGDGGLLVRAAAVLAAFLLPTAIGARVTGRRLVPGAGSTLRRALLIEGCLLLALAVLSVVIGHPAAHAT